MNDAEVHIRVSGVVQGVGFRYFVWRKAEEMGLTGFVRNAENGEVEIRAQGPGGLLDDFVRAVHIGPRGARVVRVVADVVKSSGQYSSFEIR